VRAYLAFEFWEHKISVRVFAVLPQRAFTFLYFIKYVHDVKFIMINDGAKVQIFDNLKIKFFHCAAKEFLEMYPEIYNLKQSSK